MAVPDSLVQRRAGIKDVPIQSSLQKSGRKETGTSVGVAYAWYILFNESDKRDGNCHGCVETLLQTLGLSFRLSMMSWSAGWLLQLQ